MPKVDKQVASAAKVVKTALAREANLRDDAPSFMVRDKLIEGGRPDLAAVLDRIQKVSAGKGGIKLCVYGRGKTGKTRLACTFPKPLLLIGTEDGTKSVANVAGVDFIRLQSTEEIEPLTLLLASGAYKSAVLDTGGGFQDLVLREVLGLVDMPVQKTYGMADRQTWGLVGMQWKERMSGLLNLADKGLNIVVIAHERSFNDEGNSDVMLPSVGAALTPTAAAWLNAACDYVCQAFIRQKEEIIKTEVESNGKTHTVETVSKGKAVEYCLRVGPHPVFLTGFRLPDNVSLPVDGCLVDPNYSKLDKLIRGST